MIPDDSDEPSFAEEMARMGVQPLRAGARQSAAPPRSAPRPPASQRPAERPASRQPAASRVAPQRPAASRAAPQRPAEPRLAEQRHEAPALLAHIADDRAALDRDRAALDRDRAALDRDRAALAEAREALQHERDASEAARAEVASERAAHARKLSTLEAAQARWERERGELLAQCTELRRKLAEAERALGQRPALASVLEARGCVTLDEQVAALDGLLAKRPQELLYAVQLADPAPLARLLDERVALVAGEHAGELGDDTVIVPVPPARCEIAGDSDIKAGFRRFLDACRRAGIGKMTIVGGSPAYRRQLKHLGEPHHRELRLNLVSGTQRRERKRAEADMRTSDLVVIWGSTELDHSVSAVYTTSTGNLLQVRHRGISRMLAQVAEHLSRKA